MARVGIDLAGITEQAPAVQRVEVQHRVASTHGLNDRGAWSAVTAYVAEDLVTWSDEQWAAIDSSTNVVPGSDPTKWMFVSADQHPWLPNPLQAPVTTVYADKTEQTVMHDVQVRYHLADGSVTPWTAVDGHAVAGKTTAPDDVTGFSSTTTKGNLETILTWDANTQPDWDHYEIRKGGSDWDSATYVSTTKSTLFIIVLPKPAGATYRIKAVDTSGNYSANAASTTVQPPATIGYGNGPPIGWHNAGEVIIYAPPVPGNPVGIRCITDGAPGAWEEFGSISVDTFTPGGSDSSPDIWTVGAASAAPVGGKQSDAVINNAPSLGDPVGWINIDGATWKAFGAGAAISLSPSSGMITDWNVVLASDVPAGAHLPGDAFIFRTFSPGGYCGAICITGGTSLGAQVWAYFLEREP